MTSQEISVPSLVHLHVENLTPNIKPISFKLPIQGNNAAVAAVPATKERNTRNDSTIMLTGLCNRRDRRVGSRRRSWSFKLLELVVS